MIYAEIPTSGMFSIQSWSAYPFMEMRSHFCLSKELPYTLPFLTICFTNKNVVQIHFFEDKNRPK